MDKPKVILRRCPDYDSGRIREIISEGLAELGVAPRVRGRVTIKPNVVFAHRKVAPAAFTRSEFMDGLLSALEGRAAPDTTFTIAERCGTAIPTSRMFRHAGYYRLRKKHRVRLVAIDEAKKVTVPLTRGTLHTSLKTARVIVERDLLVQAPKLKSNVLVLGPTASLKLNIGLLCDKQRMWNHNHRLGEKIVDMLEVGRPDFIATDAIECCIGGNQLTGVGVPLGLVMMATDPVAHDVVACHVLGRDPAALGYLKIAHERGYGSLKLEDYDVRGDVTLAELQRTTRDWDLWLLRADEVPGNMKVLCGEPYCQGGCHGVFLDWIYMIKDRKPKLWADLPEWTVVAGEYKGDVTARRVLLLGTCTRVDGRLRARRKVRIRGCPPRHKDIVLWMFLRGGILNPLLRVDLIIDSYLLLFFAWLRRLVKERL